MDILMAYWRDDESEYNAEPKYTKEIMPQIRNIIGEIIEKSLSLIKNIISYATSIKVRGNTRDSDENMENGISTISGRGLLSRRDLIFDARKSAAAVAFEMLLLAPRGSRASTKKPNLDFLDMPGWSELNTHPKIHSNREIKTSLEAAVERRHHDRTD